MQSASSVTVTLFVTILKVSLSHTCEPRYIFRIYLIQGLYCKLIYTLMLSSIYPLILLEFAKHE